MRRSELLFPGHRSCRCDKGVRRRRAPLRGQGPRLLRPRRRCVERPENRRHRLLPIDLRRSYWPAGSRRRGAKLTPRAGVRSLDEYICNKEETRTERRSCQYRRRSERRTAPRIPIQGADCRVLTSSSSSFWISRRVVWRASILLANSSTLLAKSSIFSRQLLTLPDFAQDMLHRHLNRVIRDTRNITHETVSSQV